MSQSKVSLIRNAKAYSNHNASQQESWEDFMGESHTEKVTLPIWDDCWNGDWLDDTKMAIAAQLEFSYTRQEEGAAIRITTDRATDESFYWGVMATTGGKKGKKALQHCSTAITGDGSLKGMRWILKQLLEFHSILPTGSCIVVIATNDDPKRLKAYRYLTRYGYEWDETQQAYFKWVM